MVKSCPRQRKKLSVTIQITSWLTFKWSQSMDSVTKVKPKCWKIGHYGHPASKILVFAKTKQNIFNRWRKVFFNSIFCLLTFLSRFSTAQSVDSCPAFFFHFFRCGKNCFVNTTTERAGKEIWNEADSEVSLVLVTVLVLAPAQLMAKSHWKDFWAGSDHGEINPHCAPPTISSPLWNIFAGWFGCRQVTCKLVNL